MIDKRLFIRTLVRHSDLVTREASFEYMEIEGERVFLECLQQLEVAFANPEVRREVMCVRTYAHVRAQPVSPDALSLAVVLMLFNAKLLLLWLPSESFSCRLQWRQTDFNHIFLNFGPPVIMEPHKVCVCACVWCTYVRLHVCVYSIVHSGHVIVI